MSGDSTPILVALPRELVERLCPGAIREAEGLARGFEPAERKLWVAGRLGAQLSYRETLTVRTQPLTEGEA